MPRKPKKETPDPQSEDQPEEAVEPPTPEVVEEKAKEEPPTPITISLTDERRSALRHVLDLMKALSIEDVTFQYDGNLNVKVMDASRVAMVVASVDLGQGLTEDVKRNFTLNQEAFAKALKLKEVSVEVGIAETIVKGKIGYSWKNAEVTIPLLEPLIEELPSPKIELTAETTLDFGTLRKALNVMADQPSYLTFDSDGKEITITGKAEFSSIVINGFESKGEAKTSYSWEYLKALGNKTWKIEYAKDMPLKASRVETDSYYKGTDRIETVVANFTVWIAPSISVD